MHEGDPGHGLDGPVVEEEREPAPLVLLGGDELLGQPGALVLALLRFRDEPRVLDRAGGEVGEHGARACDPSGGSLPSE